MESKWKAWRKYYLFSLSIFFVAAVSYWASWHWKDLPQRSVASVGQELSIHADFLENLDGLYAKHEKYAQGTAICKHFFLENKHSGMYSYISELQSFVNDKCMPGSLSVTQLQHDFDSNTLLTVACCDKFYGEYKHIRFENYLDSLSKK